MKLHECRKGLLILALIALISANACTDTAATHIRLGDDFLIKGNADAAIAEYIKASEMDPAFDVQSRINKAYAIKLDLLLQASDYNGAIEDGLKTLALHRSDSIRESIADAYIARAWFYKNKRLNPYALKDLNSAVEIAPGYFQAYYERGRFYNNQWQHSIALIDLNKSIDINPNFAPAYNERAFSYYMNQKYEKALSEANAAIEMDPSEARSYYTRSLILTALGDHDLAAADLQDTIRLSKDEILKETASTDLEKLRVTKPD